MLAFDALPSILFAYLKVHTVSQVLREKNELQVFCEKQQRCKWRKTTLAWMTPKRMMRRMRARFSFLFVFV